MSTEPSSGRAETVEQLALQIDQAQWQWLRPHLERDALIKVGGNLDLAKAGFALAKDDTESVGRWIAGGQLGKPTEDQLAAWNELPNKVFQTLIISPYVLIKESA